MPGASKPLTPGDRVPNFILPDQTGAHRVFYERVRGGPIALIFYPENEQNQALLEALSESSGQFADLGTHRFIVNRDSLDANARAATASGLDFPVLADLTGAITAGLSAGPGPGGPITIFALDANQRVLEVVRGGDPRQLVDRVLRTIREQRAGFVSQRLNTTAPVLIIPAVLDPGFCSQLITAFETGGHHEGTVASVIDGKQVERTHDAVKRRLDHHVMDDALSRRLAGTVGPRIAPELHKAFSYQGFKFDRFVVGAYDAARGDYFRPHRDNMTPETAGRRFAVTLNLNTEGYDGGALRFPEYGPHTYRPETGGVLIFSCSLIHEAMPVTRGRRYVLLSFLRSPGDAPEPDGFRQSA